MKILVTGAGGFVGRNLTEALRNNGFTEIFECVRDTPPGALDEYTKECAFVYHLAGINRASKPEEFMAGNLGFTEDLVGSLKRAGNTCPIFFASSRQAALQNPYGESKKAAEGSLAAYGAQTGAQVISCRLPNIFGKWCKPHYNSVVATFCSEIARGEPITVTDPGRLLELAYVDDVTAAFVRALDGKVTDILAQVPVYPVTVGDLAQRVASFDGLREAHSLPDLSDDLTRKLFATYTSCLPVSQLGNPLTRHADDRGYFMEFLRSPAFGQISVNLSKPGVIKGNHYHHTKHEKFLVIQGRGVISLRRVRGSEVTVYCVSGEGPESIDIPPGYAHAIKNTGVSDLLTLIWASEPFDSARPDTYPMEV